MSEIEIKQQDEPVRPEPDAVVVTEPPKSKSSSSAPWPWIGLAVLAIAALVFVLVRDNQAAAAGTKNEVVGTMDGASITKAELYDELAKQLPAGQAESALDNVMLLKMISLEADKAKVKITDADINAEMSKFKKRFANDQEFDAALQQNNMTLEGLKEQISITVKIRKIFEPQIKPTEEKVKKYFEENKDTFATTPEEVRASHILLPTKDKADAVLAQLKKGADFAALAKEKSTDPGSKDNGGDLNFFGKGSMHKEFEDAAFALKKGEMSGVVQSPSGFHIIKVTDKKAGVYPEYEQVKQQARNAFIDKEVEPLIKDWLDTQKKSYHFNNLLTPPTASGTPAPAIPAPTSANP